MKKFLLVCLTAFLMLAAGCSSGGKALSAQDIDFTFSCKADVSSPAGNYLCAFSRAGMENASVEIVSGNGKGLKWYWNGGNFNQTYCGLSAGSESCVLPCSSFASMLVKTVDGASQPGALKKSGDNVFAGSLNGYNFTLAADGKTGKIQSLDIPTPGFSFRFHDFKEPVLGAYRDINA